MFRVIAMLLIVFCLISASVVPVGGTQDKNQGAQATAEQKPSSQCGAPYCAETGRQVKPESAIVPPRVNQVFSEPEFASRIVRVTDETGIEGQYRGLSFMTNSSAEINEWGKFNPSLGANGGYYFYVTTSGGGAVPFSMDAATMQVKPHCAGVPNCRWGTGGSFSYVDPNLIYGHFGSNNEIVAHNISTSKQSRIYDLSKCPNLPNDLAGYPGAISNSGDDTKFSDYSGGKSQGAGGQVTFYDRSTDRCYWYDTSTGRLGGSAMVTTSIKAGVLASPAAPRLSTASGTLRPGDYYVQLTANVRKPSGDGETLPSPEAHIRLDSSGGIAIARPDVDNPYAMAVKGYNVYIGTAPGQETRQASVDGAQQAYTQSASLVRGATPPKSSTAGYTVHNARLSRDGKVVKIVPQTGRSMFLWWPGTTNVTVCSMHGESHSPEVASFCGGHTVLGYTHLVNHGGPTSSTSVLLHPLSDLTRFTQLIPYDVPATMDTHWSWNNANPEDTTPVCGAFSRGSFALQGDGTQNPATNPVLSIRQPWDREVVCLATSGPPKAWRFVHHHATGACNASSKDGSCFGAVAIGNVSQDGKFFLFSSDWDWNLGSDPQAPGCPKSGRCRADTFIVELK